MNTKILHCYCPSSFQDAIYGQNFRIHYRATKGWCCALCGKDVADRPDAPKKPDQEKKEGGRG